MPMDEVWQDKDSHCPDGKRYHCFEDGNGAIVADGCYAMKKCKKGDVNGSLQFFAILIESVIGSVNHCVAFNNFFTI